MPKNYNDLEELVWECLANTQTLKKDMETQKRYMNIRYGDFADSAEGIQERLYEVLKALPVDKEET